MQAGLTHKAARTGAVTLIQRFGSALNLNIPFHMLFLDGVYGDDARMRRVKAPTSETLTQLTRIIARRVARCLERQGLLAQENDEGMAATDENPMDHLRGHSITYRIAVGPQQGRKVFTLQTLPAVDIDGLATDVVGKVAGFSLHAGVAVKAHERQKLERLCRYIARPAVSEKRLSLTVNGKVRYELKTPYRDGTTQVIFEPLDFMAKLAALVPTPRVNLTRFHGVFAPNSKHRALVTLAKRGKGNKAKAVDEGQTSAERRAAMTWAQRLKRVFRIGVERCGACGGTVKIIACIEDPVAIRKILTHLSQVVPAPKGLLPEGRSPPQVELFDEFHTAIHQMLRH